MDGFVSGFLQWLRSFSLIELVALLIIPLIVDLPRSLGKCTVLLVDALYRKFNPHPVDENCRPLVSVVIPARNEASSIGRTIEATLENWWPIKEVIVIDDGSTDETYQTALPYAANGKISLIRRVGSGSKAVAVNTGITASRGDIIVVQDADTLLERSALAELVKPFSDPKVNAVSGNVRVLAGDHGNKGLLVKLQAYEYSMSMEMGRRFNALVGTIAIIPGAFGGFRRTTAAALGYFDKDTMTEDFDMTLKLRKPKGSLRFASHAIAWTFVPDTWRSWIRQRTRWHKGQLETLWKHRNIFLKQKFSIPLVVSLYDMLFMDALLLVARTAWLLILLYLYFSNLWVLMYLYFLTFTLYFCSELVVVFSAAVLSSSRSDLRYVALMPLIVLLYRPLYGLVRLRGYLEFLAGRRREW
jgi:cellulose synthase/poly-beta-1,6-N-acetylglucosamine synthase-like glycosyltransferase